MDIYDQILENLELERELGTRAVEIDRALLVPPAPEAPPIPPKPQAAEPTPAPKPERTSAPVASAAGEPCDILFLSGRQLSAAGVEAIRKTIEAMKKVRPGVVACLNENRSAKILILLGADALKGRSAGASRLVRGRWMVVDGIPAMPTFSPDYIFSHFTEGTPGMLAAKRNMWEDVKAAMARIPTS